MRLLSAVVLLISCIESSASAGTVRALSRHPFAVSDDRGSAVPTAWYAFSGLSASDVSAKLNELNARLVDIDIETAAPYAFTVTMVPNIGPYRKSWWWYYGQTEAELNAALAQNNARLVSLKAVDTGSGVRFTSIMISNTAADQKTWWWYYGLKPADISSYLDANHARLTQIHSYLSGGQKLYSVVMISNTGSDQKDWFWYYNLSPDQVVPTARNNSARPVDADVDPVTGNFNVIMESCANGCPTWYVYYGAPLSKLVDTANLLGARMIDASEYAGCGGLCSVAVMVSNNKPYLADPVSGMYLKEVGGAVLLANNENYVYEPASSIKVLVHLYAMQQVQAKAVDLTTQIPKYGNGPDSCPDPAMPAGTEPLSTALREMMWHSDNARTRELIDYFGRDKINALAKSLGLANTQLTEIIGCLRPGIDTFTLADAGKIYEGVVNGTLLQPQFRDTFFSLMAGKAEFLQEGRDYTSVWTGTLPALINQEAPASMTTAQRKAFRDSMELAYKPGGYFDCQGPCEEFYSISGWARVPFCTSSGTVGKDYIFGSFLVGAPQGAATDSAFFGFDAEALRGPIHDAIASCYPQSVAAPVFTSAGLVNAASFLGGGVAPGEIVTLFGSNFGPSTLAGLTVTNGKVTTTAGATRIYFDGVPAPVIYSVAGQASVIVPYNVAGHTQTQIEVEYQGVRSQVATATVVDTAPALFSSNSSGKGQAAALNQDSTVNSPANPEARGNVIQLYGTGEGATFPAGTDGLLATSTYPAPLQKVSVTIGGQPATVLYAGTAPTLVSGVLQVNAVIPQSVPAGSAEVIVTVGSQKSPGGVTISVK